MFRPSALFTGGTVAVLLIASLPAAAILAPEDLGAIIESLPGAPEAPSSDVCAGSSAEALATCAAVQFANGDLAGAQASAFAAATALYGDSIPARVRETYAHQFAILQNPVTNPGFLLADEGAPTDWTVDDGVMVVSGALALPAGAGASQVYGQAFYDPSLDGGVVLSPFWAPDVVELTHSGAGNVTLTLANEQFGVEWTIRVPLEDVEARERVSLLTYASDVEITPPGFTSPVIIPAEQALATSALIGLTLSASPDAALIVDDVVIDGVAYGLTAATAIDLDAELPDAGDELRPLLPAADGAVSILSAHDGYAVVILPLDFVPTVFAAEGGALSGAGSTLSGDWTFFAALIEMTPSGPRAATLDSGTISGGGDAVALTATDLSDAGATAAAFLELFRALSIEDVSGGVAVLEGAEPAGLAQLSATIVPVDSFYGVTDATGFFNYGKLGQPTRAFADLSDITPDHVLAGRAGLAAAGYAAARRTDGNDGAVASIAPLGWHPNADGNQAQALLVPDGNAEYTFDVSFLDYAGEPANGTSKILAFVPLRNASSALGMGSAEPWYDLAAYRVCSEDFQTLADIVCDGVVASTDDASFRVTIPLADIVELTAGAGGSFVPFAFLAIDGALGDVELNTTPTRGVFSPAANALLAQARASFPIDAGETGIGPYWMYAAADAASQLPTVVEFAPASDATDGVAVILTPVIDGAVATPTLAADALGNYNFSVKFREYDSLGVQLRDRAPDLDTDDFRFVLANLQAGAPRGPSSALWSISPNATIEDDEDGYRVSIPAWDIPRTSSAEPRQFLTAWSAIDIPARNTDGSATLDADMTEAAGYYNSAKLALQERAIADQFDAVAGSFVIDRALERYEIVIDAIDSAQETSRGVATDLTFRVTNAGSFREVIELGLANVDGAKVTAQVCALACPAEGPDGLQTAADAPTLDLEPGDFAQVVVRVIPLDTMLNHETSALDLVAELTHPVPGLTALETLTTTLEGSVTIDPFSYTASVSPAAVSTRWFDTPSSVLTIENGEVPDTFGFTLTSSSGLTAGTTPASIPVGNGAAEPVPFDYTVDIDTRYGSTGTVTIGIAPDHSDGDDATRSVAVTVNSSSVTFTRIGPATTIPGRAGTLVSEEWDVIYTGDYEEALNVTATHGNSVWGTPINMTVDGGSMSANSIQVPFDGRTSGGGTARLNVSFIVPANVSFSSQDTVTLRYTSADPRSTIARSPVGVETPLQLGQFTVRALTATLTLTANATKYALPGETVRQGFVATYNGEFPGTFDFEVAQSPLAGTVVALQPATQDFDGGLGTGVTVTRYLEFDVTVPGDTAYARTDGVVLHIVPQTLGWEASKTPGDKNGTIATFSLTAPTLTFADAAPRTFQNDVELVLPVTIAQPSLPAAQAAQWGARLVGYDLTHQISAGDWSDDALDAVGVSLTQGGSALLQLTAMPHEIVADSVFTVFAASTSISNALAHEQAVTVTAYTAEDLAIHTVLMGCYGASESDCDRVSGPIQAVTTHDLGSTAYSRGYLLTAVVLRGTTPAYLDFDRTSLDDALSNMSTAVHVESNPTDAMQIGDHRDARAVPGVQDDDNIPALVAGGTVVGLPLGGATQHRSMVNLLWDSADVEAGDLEWYLQHLGTMSIEVTVDLHGLIVESHYDPLRSAFPLLAESGGGVALVTTDKDDPDGDGFSTVSELRSNSNPVVRSSTPFSDDDGDESVNARDTVPVLDERCFQADLQDADGIPSCAGVSGGELGGAMSADSTPRLSPAELAPHIARLAAFFGVTLG